MADSQSFTARRACVAVVICGVLLGACGGGTGHHAAGAISVVPSPSASSSAVASSLPLTRSAFKGLMLSHPAG
jgi:hypothetical protein